MTKKLLACSVYKKVFNSISIKLLKSVFSLFIQFQFHQSLTKTFGNLVGKEDNVITIISSIFYNVFYPFLEDISIYFMLSSRISRNIRENIFQSYIGTTSENTDFHVLVA